MVFFHHIARVFQILGQAQGDVLAVAQHILPVGNDAVLCLLGEHDVQHFHGFFAARGVLLQIPVQGNLEIGGGHQPLFPVLAEEGQEDRVDALILKHLDPGRAAKVHGNFPVPEQVHHVIVSMLKILRREVGILNEPRHPFKRPRPHGIVQTHPRGVGGVAVGSAPLAPRRGGKLGGGKPLQRFHAGVIVGIIGGKAADAYCFKCLTGRRKALVIGGQRDAVLLKKAAVDHKAVGVGADRQPVHAAILVFEAVEVGVIDSARLVGHGKVHQAVFQRSRIVQREAAAGDDIRQTAVLLQKFVKIQIVVADDELNVHVRQLGLDIRRIGFVQAGAPQIHLNGLGILLLLYLFCGFCAASGQQGDRHHQCRKHRNKAAQCFCFHRFLLLIPLGQPALLHRADRVDRDVVLFCHTVKPFLGAFQCARAQHLGQLIGRLIEIGKTKVLAYTFERVCRAECFLYIFFLESVLQLWITVIVQKHPGKFTDHALTVQPLEHIFIISPHFLITFLNRHNHLFHLSFFSRHKRIVHTRCILLVPEFFILSNLSPPRTVSFRFHSRSAASSFFRVYTII